MSVRLDSRQEGKPWPRGCERIKIGCDETKGGDYTAQYVILPLCCISSAAVFLAKNID